MRARSLKPSLFKNELLAVADPIYTIIFEGLWCAADREGRLEDRPGKLHIEINPGRAFEGTERSLSWLAENNFILRYAVSAVKYIQVLAFTKHQKPHVNEKPSVIPPPTSPQGGKSNESSTTKVASENNQGDKHLALTPDSGLLTPSSLTPDSLNPSASATPTAGWFDDFKAIYPKRSGDQGWPKALRAGNARIAEGHTTEDFLSGARRYAAYCEATENTGSSYVKQAATFLGPDKPFLLEWKLPLTKSQIRQDANVSASVAWLESSDAA